MPVTTIGDRAFIDEVVDEEGYPHYNSRGLTDITIPDSVTSIGTRAFAGCSSLTSITIPDSVTSIDIWAFENCDNLRTIVCSAETADKLRNGDYGLRKAVTFVAPAADTAKEKKNDGPSLDD